MADPLTHRALELLGRGHHLYAGDHIVALPTDTTERLREHADRLVRVTARAGTGSATPATHRLAADLRRAGAVDTEVAAVLAGAHADRELGRHATRAILDDALIDPVPAADTALGRREALRRMAARLRAQRRHIHRSRRHADLLARRMRHLTYPHRRTRHANAHAIPQTAVRYHRSHVSGHVRERIARALDHLGITDPAARRHWLRGYETLIARESGGRASAVASEPATEPGPIQPDGHRLGYARGITQTIPATFAHYHQPGTSMNIYDPVANICASMNYVMHRYGVTADGANLVALVQQADRSRPPKGY